MNTAELRVTMESLLGSWLKNDSNRLGLATLLYFGVFSTVILVYWRKATHGTDPLPKLRRIAGLDAVDEAIGRATEMGRPVCFNPGTSGFSAPTFAALAVLGYIAGQTARYDARLLGCYNSPQVMSVAQSIVQTAYIEQGKAESFRLDDIRYLSGDQFGFASGCIGVIQRERIAAQMMFGNFAAEALIIAEAGNVAGAIQVAGQTNNLQTPFLVAACDYCLMNEELYVASAYLSKDRLRVGMLAAQDICRLVLMTIMVLGIIFESFGSKIVSDLMTLY
ncbi:MAG: hypothetical protein FWF06_04500 [Symbiobacteriaceae bacterium]|nr:hypothetical protein [Symbiobacteriaceae bacterium]